MTRYSGGTSESTKMASVLMSSRSPWQVPQGSARLRITLSAAHQPQQIDRLLQVTRPLQILGATYHHNRLVSEIPVVITQPVASAQRDTQIHPFLL